MGVVQIDFDVIGFVFLALQILLNFKKGLEELDVFLVLGVAYLLAPVEEQDLTLAREGNVFMRQALVDGLKVALYQGGHLLELLALFVDVQVNFPLVQHVLLQVEKVQRFDDVLQRLLHVPDAVLEGHTKFVHHYRRLL
jgi:hypothetical protein